MKEVQPMEDKNIYLLANWFEPSASAGSPPRFMAQACLPPSPTASFDRRHTMTTANLKEDCHALPAS
jgi:hypothetical protein